MVAVTGSLGSHSDTSREGERLIVSNNGGVTLVVCQSFVGVGVDLDLPATNHCISIDPSTKDSWRYLPPPHSPAGEQLVEQLVDVAFELAAVLRGGHEMYQSLAAVLDLVADLEHGI